MNAELNSEQIEAVKRLHNGAILCADVGTGKSRTALAYYIFIECRGQVQLNGKGSLRTMENPRDLYIITTAKKRDSGDWFKEAGPFCITDVPEQSHSGVKMTVDSWNNIQKYKNVVNSFFIFDEQRVVGSGPWVKAFIRIAKRNHWIMLSATPGDTWKDYIPVMVANGYYNNKSDFLRQHAVFNRYSKYPKIDRYVGEGKLIRIRKSMLVIMKKEKRANQHHENVLVSYDQTLYKTIFRKRWNIYDNEPIAEPSKLCYLLRRLVNSDQTRIDTIESLIREHPKSIIFYNYTYELEILKELCDRIGMPYSQWNGRKHEEILGGSKWVYLVQYSAGAEGWNCITTNVIIFYSMSYSYRMSIQAAGRIDRLNTPFDDLWYYHISSTSPIDIAIARALKSKKDFNESAFIKPSK